MLDLDITVSSVNWPLCIMKCACSLFWTYFVRNAAPPAFLRLQSTWQVGPSPSFNLRHLCIQSRFLKDAVHVGMAGHVLKMLMLHLMWVLLKLFTIHLTCSSKKKYCSRYTLSFSCASFRTEVGFSVCCESYFSHSLLPIFLLYCCIIESCSPQALP